MLDVERVIVAFSDGSEHEDGSTLDSRRCATLDVQIDIVPRLFEVVGPKVDDPLRSRGCRSSAFRPCVSRGRRGW